MSLERWYEMHEEDTALAAAGDAPLVFIGDSITEGWEHDGREEWTTHFLPRGAVDFGIGGFQIAANQTEKISFPTAVYL